MANVISLLEGFVNFLFSLSLPQSPAAFLEDRAAVVSHHRITVIDNDFRG